MSERTDRAERMFRILETLRAGIPVRVRQLVDEFKVSPAQVRQDLDWLEEIVPLERPYGEVRLRKSPDALPELFMSTKRHQQHSEKRLIAEYAARFVIDNGDQLLLDSGTQLEAFIEQLYEHKRTGLRVASCAANISRYFAIRADSAFVQIGGVLSHRSLTFVDGTENFSTDHFFEQVREKFLHTFCGHRGHFKAVITGTGFSNSEGLLGNTSNIIAMKRAFIEAAREVIILLDHAKFIKEARETITYCGVKADPWLHEEKPVTIIVDTGWEKSEPQSFRQFISRPSVTELELLEQKGEYKGQLRVFKTQLAPGKPKVSAT
jgi:DeoR/GlpR family transcriptional regulator of sugar metabolism